MNTWTNFRGFGKPTTVRFPRLTLLIGRNNVGKTSAYAPLLLLRQTLDARDPSTALLTRGELIDVGSFQDAVYNHDSSELMTFSVGLPRSSIHLDGTDRDVELGRLEVAFGHDRDGRARLMRSRVLDRRDKPVITRVRETDTHFSVTSSIIPTRQSVGRPLKEITELRENMRREQPSGFMFSGLESLRIPTGWRRTDERWRKARIWFNAAYDIQDVYRRVNWEAGQRLRAISYLGPLRSLPLRTYRMSAERPSDVGLNGQHAPEILFRTNAGEAKERVDAWLDRLGYGSLEFKDMGDDFFQVLLRMKDSRKLLVNLAHCGVGLSQLLPILVQCTVAEPDATIIAQQPEIHLNPAQQSLMTDFLIESTTLDRRVIIETHSEHMLLRLRRRIAEGAISSDEVAIYYCDYDKGQTVLDRIELGELGQIEPGHWPSGFFEEQLSDSLALARAQAQSKRTR